jgi:asparaginyl-tRNA synthetase
MLRQLLHTSARLRPTIRQILGSDVATGSAERVEVNGWVKSIRRQKRVAFAAISDGSTEHGLQAVFADPSLAKRCKQCG